MGIITGLLKRLTERVLCLARGTCRINANLDYHHISAQVIVSSSESGICLSEAHSTCHRLPGTGQDLPALRGQLLEIVACTAWGGGRAFDLKQCSSQSPNLVSANSWPIYFQIWVLSSPNGHSPTLKAVVRIKDCVDNVSLTMRSFDQVWLMLAGLIMGNKPCSEVRESWVSTQQSLYFLEYLV